MRHRKRGRILGRNASHRHAMWRNMATSLFLTLRDDEDAPNAPAVKGRITTTVAKAKELRPYVEKLITLAKKAIVHQEEAVRFATNATRNSAEWKSWRESDQWNKWNQTIAPAVTARRRAFALLRDHDAVNILFSDVAKRFEYRNGGYTRIVTLPKVRLGDAGVQAIIELVGENDRVRKKRSAPVVKRDEPAPTPAPAPAAETPPVAETAPTAETAPSS